MEWKAMKGITLTEVHRNVTLTLTEREADYLRNLVGMVKISHLPHAVFMNNLFEELSEQLPEIIDKPPYRVSNNSIEAVTADWE